MFFKKIHWSLVSCLLLGQACAPLKQEENPSPPLSSLEQQAFRDLDSLLPSFTGERPSDWEEFPEERVRLFDSQNGGIFRKIFGGVEASHVHRFLKDRIQFFYSDSDRLLTSMGYLEGSKDSLHARSKVTPIAANVGTELFVNSFKIGSPFFLIWRGRSVLIESPRLGLVSLSKEYQKSEYFLSSLVRVLEVLVHEARHSDCSLKDNSFEHFSKFKQTSHLDFYPKECGHLHQHCSWIPGLESIAACDSAAFGPYFVSFIGLRALFFDPQLVSLRFSGAAVQRALLVDNLSRTPPFDFKQPFIGHVQIQKGSF